MKIIEVGIPGFFARGLMWLSSLVFLFVSIFSLDLTQGISVREFSFPALIFVGFALVLLYTASIRHRVVFADGGVELQSSIANLVYRRSGVLPLNSFSGVRSVPFGAGKLPAVAIELFNEDGHFLILRVLTLASGNSEITISNRHSLAQSFCLPDCGHFPDLARFSVGFSTTALHVRFTDQQGRRSL